MILDRDVLTALVLDLKFFEIIIIGGNIPYEGCSAPMVDLSNHNFLSAINKTFKPGNPLLTRTLKNYLNLRAQ